MDHIAREKFFQRIDAALLGARGFFECVDEHFRQRNNVDVRFTHAAVADMRLWAVWVDDEDKHLNRYSLHSLGSLISKLCLPKQSLHRTSLFILVSATLYRQVMRAKRRTAKYCCLKKIGAMGRFRSFVRLKQPR